MRNVFNWWERWNLRRLLTLGVIVVIAWLRLQPASAQTPTVFTVRISQRYNCSQGQCFIQHGTAAPWRHRDGGTEFVTCAHVVDKGTTCTVHNKPATVTYRNNTDDVALVFVPNYTSQVKYPIASDGPKTNQRVAIYGRSKNGGNQQYVIAGNVVAWIQGVATSGDLRNTNRGGNITRANANAFSVHQFIGGRRAPVNTNIVGAMSGGIVFADVTNNGRTRRCVVGVLSAANQQECIVSRLTSLERFRSVRLRQRSATARLQQVLDRGIDPLGPIVDASLGAPFRLGPNADCVATNFPCSPQCTPGTCRGQCGRCITPPTPSRRPQPQRPAPQPKKDVLRCPPPQIYVQGGKQGEPGQRGPKGDKGDKPSQAELLALIKRVIQSNPERFRGQPGTNGTNGTSISEQQVATMLEQVINNNPERFRGQPGTNGTNANVQPTQIVLVDPETGETIRDLGTLRMDGQPLRIPWRDPWRDGSVSSSAELNEVKQQIADLQNRKITTDVVVIDTSSSKANPRVVSGPTSYQITGENREPIVLDMADFILPKQRGDQ